MPKDGQAPYLISTDEYVRKVCGRMSIPGGHAKIFRKFFYSKESTKVLDAAFWFCFASLVQKDEEIAEKWKRKLAVAYMQFFATLKTRNDLVSRYYVWALAETVIETFYSLYRSSRGLFTASFENDIFLKLSYWITGIQFNIVGIDEIKGSMFASKYAPGKLAAADKLRNRSKASNLGEAEGTVSEIGSSPSIAGDRDPAVPADLEFFKKKMKQLHVYRSPEMKPVTLSSVSRLNTRSGFDVYQTSPLISMLLSIEDSEFLIRHRVVKRSTSCVPPGQAYTIKSYASQMDDRDRSVDAIETYHDTKELVEEQVHEQEQSLKNALFMLNHRCETVLGSNDEMKQEVLGILTRVVPKKLKANHAPILKNSGAPRSQSSML